MNKVRVRVSTKNEERNGEEERKRESGAAKMKEIRVQGFYIRRWTGWVLTRSSAPHSWPLDLDPTGSGSIQHP